MVALSSYRIVIVLCGDSCSDERRAQGHFMNTTNQPRRSPLKRYAMLALSILALGAAIFVTAGAVGAAMGIPLAGHDYGHTAGKQGPIQSGTPPTGRKGHATCDEPGQPTCPPEPNDSVYLAVATPATVLAAMPTIPGYMTPVEAASAPAGSTYSFDTPVLVLPATMGNSNGDDNLPHYVVRASINGVRMVTYDYTYDPATHMLKSGPIGGSVPNDPGYGKPFPWYGVSASAAITTLHTSRGLALAATTQPQLVFFGLNPAVMNPAHPLKWFAGGESDGDPIWRLKGGDGKLYFVGIDGHVYTPSQLPIEPGATFVQV